MKPHDRCIGILRVAGLLEESGIDDTDIKILCFLRENSRMSNSEIAKKIGTSEATVRRRIKKMEEKGIISGFSVLMDCSGVGGIVKVIFHIRVEQKSLERVASNLKEKPSIVEIHKVSGDYDLIAKAVFSSADEMRDFMNREMNIDGIQMVVSYVVAKSYKKSIWEAV